MAGLVEGKFYPLFALLFGMGLALQAARARVAGRPFLPTAGRRLGVLLALGIAHGVLLYAGDILAFYAPLGWVALPLKRGTSGYASTS